MTSTTITTMAAPALPTTFTALSAEIIPAMLPPPGQVSNFTNPPSLHPVVLTVAISTMALMVPAVCVRIYTKAVLMRDSIKAAAEEYFAVLALAGILLWDSIYVHVSLSGFSRHLWDVPLSRVSSFAYISYLAQISYTLTMFAAKSSILFQIKTLFCPDSPSHRRLFRRRRRIGGGGGGIGGSANPVSWALYGLMFLNGAYSLAAFIVILFQCTPREKAWDLIGDAARRGKCIDVAAATVVSAVMNLVLDLGILIVPIWAIWRLRLSLKKRLGTSAVFAVGGVTCVIAAVGVSVRVPLLKPQEGGGEGADLTWVITKVGIWTMVEFFGTILVGCMPSFPRFFLFLRGKEPSTNAASTAASKPSSKDLGRRSVELSIQVPPPARRKDSSPLEKHYNNLRKLLSGPKEKLIVACAGRRSSTSTTSGSPIGMAISTSEVSFNSRRMMDTGAAASQDIDYVELEEGRYSQDNGGHVGYASSLSGVMSSCSDDEGAEIAVALGPVASHDDYYDDMEEYWSGPAGRRSF